MEEQYSGIRTKRLEGTGFGTSHLRGSYLLVWQLLLVPVVLHAGQLLEQHRRVHFQALVQLTERHPLPVEEHTSTNYWEVPHKDNTACTRPGI